QPSTKAAQTISHTFNGSRINKSYYRQASLLSVSDNRQRRHTADQSYEFAPPHGAPTDLKSSIVAGRNDLAEGAASELPDVRFGSKADMWAAKRNVRFTPNRGRESEIPQKAVSALPSKADMCSALPQCLLRAISGHGRVRYSIASAARAISAGGIVRLIAFAVLRLMTNSNLVAA